MTREEILAVAKPILFNTEMVRAIKNNRKTVTRRAIKPQPADTYDCQHEMQTYDQMLPNFYKGDYSCACRKCGYGTQQNGESMFQPPYRPGDILYVRETWCDPSGDGYPYLYKADMPMHWDAEDTETGVAVDLKAEDYKWRPPTRMPKEAVRLFLRVTGVRVERLQEITELDILEKEGITVDFPQPKPSYMSLAYTETRLKPAVRKAFADLWNTTIKPADLALYGWESNPWVWVIGFEKMEVEK